MSTPENIAKIDHVSVEARFDHADRLIGLAVR